MGKVLDVKSDTHTGEIEQEVNRLYFSKNKSDTDHNPDMVVLNEYMEYFESLNTVCRHIVHIQRDVISQVGSNRWVKLSTKEQDETLNKKLINSKCRPSLKDEIGATSDVDWFPRLKSRSGKEPRELLELGNRDSIQSFSELDAPDGFAGPFSWETRSQQDLTFPPTPTAKPKKEMNQRPVTVPKVTEGKPETKEDKNNNLSTLDELKEQLRKNYKEAQAARERFKSLKSPKTLEGITKNSPNVKARVGSPKESSTDFTDFSKTLSSIHQNWVQVLPTGPKESIGNGHTKQFSPDKFTWSKGQFTLTTQNSTPSENGHVITDSSPKKAFEFWSKTSPKKSDEETSLLLPLKLNHSPDSTTKLLDSSEASQTEDIDSDEDVISDLFSNKIESSSSGNSKPSKQGSGSSWKSLYSPEKDAKDFEKEISEDFSQFLSTYTTKGDSNSDSVDIMELLKNW